MRSLALIVIPLLTASLPACSADGNSDPDASGLTLVDARTGNGIPDARGIRPDARDLPDSGQVACDGADTEPNDTQLAATSLAVDPLDCGDTASAGEIPGSVISGNEDWFTVNVDDGNLCSVNPTFSIVGNVQVCAYFTCLLGDNELDVDDFACPDPDSTPSGINGCCTPGGFAMPASNIDCVGTLSEDLKVDVQITALSTDVCEAYTISYNM